ncbi:hypothetical protein BC567DRAFT_57229 [Phyllosticta citribraziliensis]
MSKLSIRLDAVAILSTWWWPITSSHTAKTPGTSPTPSRSLSLPSTAPVKASSTSCPTSCGSRSGSAARPSSCSRATRSWRARARWPRSWPRASTSCATPWRRERGEYGHGGGRVAQEVWTAAAAAGLRRPSYRQRWFSRLAWLIAWCRTTFGCAAARTAYSHVVTEIR